MPKVIPCFFSLIMICFIAFAQDNKYKNYKYEWSAEKPPETKVDEQFKDADAVILEETNLISITTNYESRYVRIKFLTQKGIDKFSTFKLPGSYDALTDNTELPFWSSDSVIRPKGEFGSMKYFACRIIKADGKILFPDFSEKIQKEIFRINQGERTYYAWTLKVKDLQVGDELEANYAYDNIYGRPNGVGRIFFNGEIPKQNTTLKVRYPEDDYYIFMNLNGCPVPDTAEYKVTNPKSKEFTWKLKNLNGCISEKKSRPFMELPYLAFYKHPEDFGELSNNRTYVKKYMPLNWAYYINLRLGYEERTRDDMLSKTDEATISVKKFCEEQSVGLSDTSNSYRFATIHRFINDSFAFDKNLDYLSGDDGRLLKTGNALERHVLNRLRRYFLYDKIALRLGGQYSLMFLHDKRLNQIDYNLYSGYPATQAYYIYPYKKSNLFFAPKLSRFGLEINELPFYFEDINTFIIPQTLPYDERFNTTKNVPVIPYTTPFSTISDNTRSTNVMCNVSLANKSTTFETRLNLSGQFSTLTRGFYLYGEMDSTLEACYYKPVYELSSSSKLVSKEMTSRKTTFPYECNFKLKYADESVLISTGSGTYKLSLKNWFNNLYDNSLEVKNRVTAYYPDFVYSDMHRYMIKLDKAVEITNLNDFNFKEENSYGKYVVVLKAVDETSYMLETTLVVNAEKVEAQKINDVKTIFNKIEKMNAAELALKEK